MVSVRIITSVAFLACFLAVTYAECNQVCTDDWDPVCAKNYKGEAYIFGNPCEYNSVQCLNPTAGWLQTKYSDCLVRENNKNCPQKCTLEWNPVCAKNFDGVYHIFGNPCDLEAAQCFNPSAGWKMTKKGNCAQTRKGCSKLCTLEWNPVCAKNSEGLYHTFGNPCEFESAQCLNAAAGWTRTRDGTCAQTRKECPKICTQEWKPICAKNYQGEMKTFGNLCQLESAQCLDSAAGWLSTREGTCAQTRKECLKTCTKEWNPVCAKNNNGQFHTFGNPCEFEVAQCLNSASGWTRTRDGTCAQTRKVCPQICTQEWKPICAKNLQGEMKTFGNLCQLESAQCLDSAKGWMRTRDGTCAQTRNECLKTCTKEWKPVCAKNIDGQFHTFGNPCEFEVAQCLNSALGWTRTRDGVCAQTREECPKICTQEWKPICAKNLQGEMKTFGNLCQLESTQCLDSAEGWMRTKDGICAQTRNECLKTCTKEWNPVCAKNINGQFHTFGNPCEFEVVQCLNSASGWTRTRDGTCAQTRKTCPQICTQEWKPICAKNFQGEMKTFGNLCQLESAQCLDSAEGWMRTRDGTCAQTRNECSKICTQEWNPVCAKNNNGQFHTFGNPCEFESTQCLNLAAGWTRTRDGVCAQTRKECPKVCTLEWSPVCAKNYQGEAKTFGNSCQLEVAQCNNPSTGWFQTKSGKC